MSTATGLADLLFGPARGAILVLLYGRVDQSFYIRQIAREVVASVGAVQREIENLSKVGLIIRQSVGNQVFYRANREAPIFRDAGSGKQDHWHLRHPAVGATPFIDLCIKNASQFEAHCAVLPKKRDNSATLAPGFIPDSR